MSSFDIVTIETSSLGDRSYLVTDGEVAVVVDPQRDIDRVVDLLSRLGVRLATVVETHVHNDYVSGGLALARHTGADYVLPAGSDIAFEHTAVADGDTITVGKMALRAMLTPGHTFTHTSYALSAGEGAGEVDVEAVFTGGSMLFGATGRTDLVGPEHTDELTHAQYHSVQRLARELPEAAAVYPTHGFGSFCSATPTSGSDSTVGEQQRKNPALTLAEQEFVDQLLAGLGAYPAYYAHMGPFNRAGADAPDLTMPSIVDPDTVRARIEAGEWVVDLRNRKAFAAGHLAGSLGFELSDNFVTYLGWLYRYGSPLTLIGENEDQILDARRELVRIGIDELSGAAVGEPADLAAGESLRSYPVTDFAGLAAEMAEREVPVLDTRRNDERAKGYVRSSIHVPLHELAGRMDEIPTGELWVHCGSGYRASIATSMLDEPGRQVVLISDEYAHAQELGLEVSPDADSGSESSADSETDPGADSHADSDTDTEAAE